MNVRVLVGLGTVVFLANAGLLVLQLLAGRYLAPYIGSSIETWTTIIGVFLTGIALGNHHGGKIADRTPSTRTLGKLLLFGALSTIVVLAWDRILQSTGFDSAIPLTPRILVISALFCFPPAYFLSLMTPVSIKLMLPEVSKMGRIAGLVFSLGTLGCLIGNYATGFWLMAEFTLDAITIGVSFGFLALGLILWFVDYTPPALPAQSAAESRASSTAAEEGSKPTIDFRKDIRLAFLVVFLSSFCGMSLELTASRVLAPVLGVSLYTWTGIIGVMLAGTAAGNYLGGVLADRGPKVAVARFALLIAGIIGLIVGPALCRSVLPFEMIPTSLVCRIIGLVVGVVAVLIGTKIGGSPLGAILNLFAIGGLIGTSLSHTVANSIYEKFPKFSDSVDRMFTNADGVFQLSLYHGAVHTIGFVVGGLICTMLFFEKRDPNKPSNPILALSGCWFAASITTLTVLIASGICQRYAFMNSLDISTRVMAWTFALFFLPMLALGTISPQVIRLSITDASKAGRTAGSIYAWSTVGAIVGTFATGYFLIGFLGTARVLLGIALLLVAMALLVGRLWKNSSALFSSSIIAAGALFGMFYVDYSGGKYTMETKYFAIHVQEREDIVPGRKLKTLALDRLLHSSVDPEDPTYIYYSHEQIQGELTRFADEQSQGNARVLVIGGGGYTFPRWIEDQVPRVKVDVVEIDPGVTEVAYRYLGLSRQTKIRSFNMDGRQYVREISEKGYYDLVVQDAVNDLSVPYHLMTREYNEAVKKTLKPGGAYLLTLIDSLEGGDLWRAAMTTMRQSFKHIELLDPSNFDDTKNRRVYVIYGSDEPLNMKALRESMGKHYDAAKSHRLISEASAAASTVVGPDATIHLGLLRAWNEARIWTNAIDAKQLEKIESMRKGLLLTDQFAPVDNLMSDVFRKRE
jgi:spermidine synthase